jgi:hypothetical protein
MSAAHSGHVFAGLDPGESGAFVSVSVLLNIIRFSKLTDVQLWREIHNLAEECRDRGIPLTVILEKLSVRPPTSASRGGVMMAQFGMCRGFLIAAGVRFIEVTPAVWARKMGRTDPKKTPYSKKKQRNLELAQQLYPDRKVILETADAFLLAEYGRRFHQ